MFVLFLNIPQYSLIVALYANEITSYMKMDTMVISATCFNVLSKLLKKIDLIGPEKNITQTFQIIKFVAI